MSEILSLENVTKRYGRGPDAPRVLDGVDFSLETGRAVSIIGPSGSGKSTLLNLVSALDRPSEGTVRLDGEDLSALDEKDLARLRNRKLGFVFQLHHLLGQCTVLENVLVPTLAGWEGEEGAETPEDRARRLLERVGLAHRLDHRPGQLSGGEQQRVSVVRALINRPKLLLADEPTGSLDRKASDAMAELLVELNREEGVTLIVVTHAIDLAEHMEQVYTLRDGKLHVREEGGE